ncbi:hypothetical protein [Microscilla marina]|uniref:Outer membrane protein beta-barrel domain-containing protein n=1 Tax=Microscilla marina ATCC 23134 TaxID=313606 RepID=A1ZJE1_MICM2|nr:hypothetical protein [Microscilla marina]EAY29677.1 hypothetical protein M23134_00561 [Microscilla marina ATCC 23134]
MKKLVSLSVLLAILVNYTQAQDFKGRKSLGLSLGTHKLENNGGLDSLANGRNSWTIAPNIAYFVNNQWKVGVSASFSYTYYHYKTLRYQNIGDNTVWGLEAFATHHHWFTSQWAFFTQPGIGYNQRHFEYTSHAIGHPTYTEKGASQSFYVNTEVGLLFMIGKKLGIDMSTTLFKLNYLILDANISNQHAPVLASRNQTNFSSALLGGSLLSSLQHLQLGLKFFW